MNKATLAALAALAGLFLILVFSEARAETIAPPAAEIAAPAADPVATLVADLAIKYPFLVSLLAVVGLLRLLVKPVMEFLRARARATATKDDDERLDRIERSWWMRALLFVLDWGASIKPIK